MPNYKPGEIVMYLGNNGLRIPTLVLAAPVTQSHTHIELQTAERQRGWSNSLRPLTPLERLLYA